MFSITVKQQVPLLNRQSEWIRFEANDVRPSSYDSKLKCTVINFLTMEQFTSKEYLDTVLLYGDVRQNSRAAARLYAERFPQRRAPYHRTITAAVQQITDTRNVMPSHARAGTSTTVARCVGNSFNETSQFPREL